MPSPKYGRVGAGHGRHDGSTRAARGLCALAFAVLTLEASDAHGQHRRDAAEPPGINWCIARYVGGPESGPRRVSLHNVLIGISGVDKNGDCWPADESTAARRLAQQGCLNGKWEPPGKKISRERMHPAARLQPAVGSYSLGNADLHVACGGTAGVRKFQQQFCVTSIASDGGQREVGALPGDEGFSRLAQQHHGRACIDDQNGQGDYVDKKRRALVAAALLLALGVAFIAGGLWRAQYGTRSVAGWQRAWIAATGVLTILFGQGLVLLATICALGDAQMACLAFEDASSQVLQPKHVLRGHRAMRAGEPLEHRRNHGERATCNTTAVKV